jgi:hypothetical protein
VETFDIEEIVDEVTQEAPQEEKPKQEKIRGPWDCLVTPEEARQVWEATRLPTFAKVAKYFFDVGRPVTPKTLSKWKNNGWARKKESSRGGRPFSNPAKNLERTVTLLNGYSSNGRLEDFVTDDLIIRLSDMSDAELLNDANRYICKAVIGVSEEVLRQRRILTSTCTLDLGTLMKSLGQTLAAVNIDVAKILEGTKTINAHEEKDRKDKASLKDAMRAFKAAAKNGDE